jgi:hypothetical protein
MAHVRRTVTRCGESAREGIADIAWTSPKGRESELARPRGRGHV